MAPERFGILVCCLASALASSACDEQPGVMMETGGSPVAGGASPATAGAGPAAAGASGVGTGGVPTSSGSGGGLATAGVSGMGGAQASAGDWLDPAWTQRQSVTISDPALTEELHEFQVLVKLDAQSFEYAGAQAHGEDLRFVTTDGLVLKHEVEKWDPIGGSLIWLMLPTLSSTPVQLWLYFGNSLALAPTEQDRRAVWPMPYAAVWHLASDVTDSSPNAHAAENVGGTFMAAMLGGGMQLTRAQKQYVIVAQNGPVPIISGADGSTLSAWVRPAQIDGSPGDGGDEQDNGSVLFTIGGHSTGNHNSYTGYNVSYEGRMITHVDPADQGSYRRVRSDPRAINMDEWSWLTYVVDLPAGEVRFYKNGAAVGVFSEGAFNATKYDPAASLRVVIGSEEDLTKHFWDGMLDELRVEQGMRSASFIAAQYRAMTTPGYVTVSAAQTSAPAFSE